MDIQKRAELLGLLGPLRGQVLWCLGGNWEGHPGFFRLNDAPDVVLAYERHLDALGELWRDTTDDITKLLLSAGRLLCGFPAEAEVLIAHVSDAEGMNPHAKGRCILMPFRVCAAALPLPEALRDTRRWIAGSAEQAALWSWLAEHRDRLIWDRAEGVYRL